MELTLAQSNASLREEDQSPPPPRVTSTHRVIIGFRNAARCTCTDAAGFRRLLTTSRREGEAFARRVLHRFSVLYAKQKRQCGVQRKVKPGNEFWNWDLWLVIIGKRVQQRRGGWLAGRVVRGRKTLYPKIYEIWF